MSPLLEDYRQQFEQIAVDAKDLTDGLTEAQFNWRPTPAEWSIGECLSHLIAVGTEELGTIGKAIEQGRARGLTAPGSPFELSAIERFLMRETEPPARHSVPTTKRFQPIHGQPVTGVLPTFLHLQRQLTILIEEMDGLDLRRIKVPMPISSLFKLSLGATVAQCAAHERRHLAQARRVRQKLP